MRQTDNEILSTLLSELTWARRAMEGYFWGCTKMIKKEDILAFIRQNRHYLKEHFFVKKIGLFGSFVHDVQTEDSDIDIIIELEDNTPGIYELKEELRAFFGEEFQRDVDIAREKYLKSYVKAQINNEAVYVE